MPFIALLRTYIRTYVRTDFQETFQIVGRQTDEFLFVALGMQGSLGGGVENHQPSTAAEAPFGVTTASASLSRTVGLL